jgi:hypothetical protein
MGKDSRSTIREILDGFALFINKISKKRLLNLVLIKVCIYEKNSDMLRIFEDEMKVLANKKKFKETPWYPKIYENVINLLQSFSNPDEPVISKSSSDENKKPIKFKLISDDQEKINNAKN